MLVPTKGWKLTNHHNRMLVFTVSASPSKCACTVCGQLVSKLLFNVPFQCKYDYIREKRSGVESYLYPMKEGQRYINLNPGCLSVQQPPKKERDREAHLKYYASTDNRGRQLSYRQTKPNTTKHQNKS